MGVIMPNFYWNGIDSAGQILSGYRVAGDVGELKDQLLTDNIALLSAKPKLNLWFQSKKLFWGKKLSTYEFVSFFEQLSILISGGVELWEALNTISVQTQNQKIKHIIEHIKREVEYGKHLSAALGGLPKIFDDFIVQMIGVGEESGKLDLVLTELAEHLKQSYELRRDLLNSAAVPLFTLFFAMAIIIVIFVGVVPQFQTFFSSLGKKIPSSTQRLIAISDFLRSWNLLFIILFFIATGVVLFLAFGKTKIKRGTDFVLLRSPFFSRLIILSNLAGFLQALNLLLKSGIPLRNAILTARAAVKNVYLKEKLDEVAGQLAVGKSLADSFGALQGFYQCDMLVSLIRVGEQAGSLNVVLDKACLFFSSELKRSTVLMTSFFQPLLLVVVGIIVGIIVWIIYLPIINLAYSLG
jgi:type II secretory pathway component PulF